MAAYLEACLEEADGDTAFIAKTLGEITPTKGVAQVAKDAGLSRESLHKALSGERSPDFDAIIKVIGGSIPSPFCFRRRPIQFSVAAAVEAGEAVTGFAPRIRHGGKGDGGVVKGTSRLIV
jgi:probable addiction module antidote protein